MQTGPEKKRYPKEVASLSEKIVKKRSTFTEVIAKLKPGYRLFGPLCILNFILLHKTFIHHESEKRTHHAIVHIFISKLSDFKKFKILKIILLPHSRKVATTWLML